MALQFLNSGLRRVQRLLLHHYGLRHVIGRAGLASDLFADEGFRLIVTSRRLPLHIGELFKKALDGLLVVSIHRRRTPYLPTVITLPAGR